MLLNLGQGQFLDVTEGVGLGFSALEEEAVDGAALGDIDNDGDLDLLIGRPHFLFTNDGNGLFSDQRDRSGISEVGWNLSLGDYDLDGFLDMALGGMIGGRLVLYHNNGNGNHWLGVELVGVKSNRSGIGARLIATSGELHQTREILGGLGYNQDELVAHFGLGQRTRVDRLEVRWPSGQVDVLEDIPADQRIRVFEGGQGYHQVRPTAWEGRDSLVVGAAHEFAVRLRPALFESAAQITRVTADLSALGGPAAVPLAEAGNGTYSFSTSLPAPQSTGLKLVSISIDQITSLGPHWTGLSRSVAVLPTADMLIFDEALSPEWQEEHHRTVEIADLAHSGEAHAGRVVGLFQVKGSFSGWTIAFRATVPVEPFGYRLRFAIRPGEMTLPGNARFTVILIPGKAVSLLDRAWLDVNRQEWQVVEIPVDALQGPIEAIAFSGNYAGTFYLDDIRLVAATPPPVTVVEEEHTPALPQSFSLSQNFPNPFNSETVIRFALPESGEVELAVYNLAGQEVVKLVQGVREVGSYTVRWDGRDGRGKELASGGYLYRLRAGERVETRKLVLVR
jgi:hypothetical protein